MLHFNVTIEDETSLLCSRNGSGKQTRINKEVQENQKKKIEISNKDLVKEVEEFIPV